MAADDLVIWVAKPSAMILNYNVCNVDIIVFLWSEFQ